jgi:hypothetical protein
MALPDFGFLINFIGLKTAKKDTTYRAAVPVEEIVTVSLRFSATGDSYTSLQYLFKISKQAFSQIIPEAHSLRRFFPSVVFSAFIIMLGMCWIPEYSLSVVQFC